MTEEELKVRKSLKQERANRLYLERVYYTGKLRSDSLDVLISTISAIVTGIGFFVIDDTLTKIVCGVGEAGSITSLAISVVSGIKNYKKQNSKEAEHTALEAQDPEDIDLEESYQPVLR